MERLFSPCTRYQDIVELQDGREKFSGQHPDGLQELNLDVSTEELISAEREFTYADLYAMLENGTTVAWLTPHAAILRAQGAEYLCSCHLKVDNYRFHYKFELGVDGNKIEGMARSSEALSEIVDVVRRLLLADVSEVYELELRDLGRLDTVFFDAPTLAHLMEQCRSLKVLTFYQLNSFDENHFRVLGDYSRPGLDIELMNCMNNEAAVGELMQVLGRNQGPTMLSGCFIDEFVLASGLRGNSSLKSLKVGLSFSEGASSEGASSDCDAGNQEAITIAGGLGENKGLVDFRLHGEMSDKAWGAVCDSLKTHPTLQVLHLWPRSRSMWQVPLGPMGISSQIQALLDMLKVNISIHTIHLDPGYSQHEIFRGLVIPYLETNRFRPRVRAIQKTRPIAYRAKVLGRALLAARTNANSFWMILSGYAEVAFPPTTAIAAATVSLPITPATNADVSTAAATGDVSTTAAGASAAVTPTPGQKRKARH
jgi:hypothetical protein